MYAPTLKELSLSSKKNGLPDKGVVALPTLPGLRCLRLLSYDVSVVQGLQGAVDFGTLETLQVVGGRVTSAVWDALKNRGGLSRLRKLSIEIAPMVMVAVPEMCTVALEEGHMVWKEGNGPAPYGASAEFAEVMAKRCKGLKAVSFVQWYWVDCAMKMKMEDLEVLARGCTGIEIYTYLSISIFL